MLSSIKTQEVQIELEIKMLSARLEHMSYTSKITLKHLKVPGAKGLII